MLISKNDTTNIEEKINRFEEKHSFKFPSDYRLFLERYNGGATPKTEFKKNRRWTDVRDFYGFTDENDIHGFYWMEKQWFYDEYLEEKILPIADTNFGDYILLGIGESNYGQVYFKYHDKKKKYIKLTETFKEFVDTCRSKKIGHVKSILERKQSQYEKGNYKKLDENQIKGWQDEIDVYKDIFQEEVNFSKEYVPITREKIEIINNDESLSFEELQKKYNIENNKEKKFHYYFLMFEKANSNEQYEILYSSFLNNYKNINSFPAIVYLEVLKDLVKKDINIFRKIKINREIKKIANEYLKKEIKFDEEYMDRKIKNYFGLYTDEKIRTRFKELL